MKHTTPILSVTVLALLLISGMALGQQGCHGGQLQACQPEAAQQMGLSQQTMCPMMQKMMGGGMMSRGTMGQGMMGDPVCKDLHKSGGPGFYEKYAEDLGLSEQQVKDLKAIWSAHKKGVIRKKADIQIAKIELGEILGQDSIDFGKAKAKVMQIGSLDQDIRLDLLSSIEKAQKVLTTEQLAKFKTLKGQCCKGMMKTGMMKSGTMGMGMMKKDE